MGYDKSRFHGEVDGELLCPICSDVLEDPLQVSQCEHVFCEDCIAAWLEREQTCPVDRQRIATKSLKPVPRIFRNLLSRLKVSCDNSSFGCSAIIQLDRLTLHQKECEHNPKRLVPCENGCGLDIPKAELRKHNCVQELRFMIQNSQKNINGLQKQLAELRSELSLLKEYIRTVRLLNPPVLACIESNEQHQMIEWSDSLEIARVSCWGGIISTPDTVLRAMVRRALSESGCPPHTAFELMENAHEQRWPPGLLTLDVRQTNRKCCENFVCKRVPGKQAIVVMFCDNLHMNDDMILDPGMVMIFAYGLD